EAEVQDTQTVLLPDAQSGWQHFTGLSLALNSDHTGLSGKGWIDNYQDQPISWSILDDNLRIEFTEKVSHFNYYSAPFTDIAETYGQPIADELNRLVQLGTIESSLQIEVQEGELSKTLQKESSNGNVLRVNVSTVYEQELIIPAEWNWQSTSTKVTTTSESIQNYHTELTSVITDLDVNDMEGFWGVFLHYQHQNGPVYGNNELTFGVYADEIEFLNNGSTNTLYSGYDFNWALTNNTIELIEGTTRFVIKPFSQLEKAYLAYIEQYNDGQLVRVFTSQLSKHDNSFTSFTQNIATELPQVTLAGINNVYPSSWDGNKLNLEDVWGYHFKVDGTLRRGVSGQYDDVETKSNPSFYMGDAWTYSVSGSLVTLSQSTDERVRERTWRVMSVDSTGKALVLERSIYGYDLDDDGEITAEETGNFIPPRFNILTKTDLSQWPEAWASLIDSDGDGLNDYVEVDMGTDPHDADSDNDG
ncbi:thrombospondin type 3 repeat-containing protein, partial [Litorilituus lipolyticus]